MGAGGMGGGERRGTGVGPRGGGGDVTCVGARVMGGCHRGGGHGRETQITRGFLGGGDVKKYRK